MATLYPMKVELHVKLIDDDGTEATVTYQLPIMRVPDDAKVSEAFRAIKDKVDEATKGKFRFMTHDEFMNSQIRENTGSSERFAIPPLDAGDDWYSV